MAYSPNNGGTCWAVSDNDGSTAPLGAAPAGTEYARVGTSGTGSAACSTAVANFPVSGAAVGLTWKVSYPTNAPGAF